MLLDQILSLKMVIRVPQPQPMPRYINWLDSGIHNPKVGSSSLPLGTEMAL